MFEEELALVQDRVDAKAAKIRGVAASLEQLQQAVDDCLWKTKELNENAKDYLSMCLCLFIETC